MSDITRKRGDTYFEEFVVQVNGSPLDVSGYEFLLTVDPEKAPVDATNNIFVLTGVILDGPNGRVGFAPDAMEADNVGKYFYDIQMKEISSGRFRTIVSAKWTMEQDITKDET